MKILSEKDTWLQLHVELEHSSVHQHSLSITSLMVTGMNSQSVGMNLNKKKSLFHCFHILVSTQSTMKYGEEQTIVNDRVSSRL